MKPGQSDSERAKEYSDCAEQLWKANKNNNEKLAEMVFSWYDLPAIVHVLPNMDKLLADLQKRSFMLGVIAVLHQAELDENLGGIVQ